jgi:hypothetical protein
MRSALPAAANCFTTCSTSNAASLRFSYSCEAGAAADVGHVIKRRSHKTRHCQRLVLALCGYENKPQPKPEQCAPSSSCGLAGNWEPTLSDMCFKTYAGSTFWLLMACSAACAAAIQLQHDSSR